MEFLLVLSVIGKNIVLNWAFEMETNMYPYRKSQFGHVSGIEIFIKAILSGLSYTTVVYFMRFS